MSVKDTKKLIEYRKQEATTAYPEKCCAHCRWCRSDGCKSRCGKHAIVIAYFGLCKDYEHWSNR